MDFLVRLTAVCAMSVATIATVPAGADYQGLDGYCPTYGFETSHDGYPRAGQESEAAGATTYVIIEAESGTSQQIDGETVIVVQEPTPTAATAAAPPPPQTVVVEQSVVRCVEGIWVDPYWWVEGHCVVERVNYVFVQPRWDYYSSVWWFVPGYYRPYGVYVGFGYYRPWHWYPPYHHPYYRTRHPVPVHRAVPRRPPTVRTTPVPRRGVLSRPGHTGGRTTTVGRRPPTTYGRTTAPPDDLRAHHGRRACGRNSDSNGDRDTNTTSRESGRHRRSTAPTRTSGVRRPSAARPSVGRPSPRPSTRGTFGRPSVGRSSVGRPSFGTSRSSGGRPGGFSRPSSGGFGGSRSVPTARSR
ncbi:MAG: hypothetical protein JRF42_11685 [Deltaproteobacteria bacterium]|nr:hypothetical protein [Deltaproteobacteria bacterium]